MNPVAKLANASTMMVVSGGQKAREYGDIESLSAGWFAEVFFS